MTKPVEVQFGKQPNAAPVVQFGKQPATSAVHASVPQSAPQNTVPAAAVDVVPDADDSGDDETD